MALSVLNVFFSRQLGGIEQAFLDYSAALIAHGHRVHGLVHPRCQFRGALEALGVDIHTLNNRGHYDLISAWRLRQLANRVRPDIAVGHNGRAYNLLHLALGGRLPLVAVMHNDNAKRALRLDHIFCVNRAIRDKLLGLGRAPQTVDVMPNMIAIERNAELRQREFHRPVVIGAMGRLCRQKGFDILLNALATLHRDHPEFAFRLRLAGGGELEAALKAQAAELHLNDRIDFLGWIDDKARFFDAVDLFVLPSREEPFGIVLLEAFRYGAPVIASRCAGPLDFIRDGHNGLLVPIEDAAVLAQTIHSLAQDPVRAHGLAQQGFVEAREHYSRERVGERLQARLLEIVATHRQRQEKNSTRA